jgi:20S proteasome alpha/beta subunit
MTTIALDCNGLVACDTRETAGSTIVDDNCDKHKQVGDIHFWCAGRSADDILLIEAVIGSPMADYPSDVCVTALVWLDGGFYTAGITSIDGYYFQKERKGNAVALGSGSHHALTAMDLGKSAKDAVKYANKRDTNTGSKVKTWQF